MTALPRSNRRGARGRVVVRRPVCGRVRWARTRRARARRRRDSDRDRRGRSGAVPSIVDLVPGGELGRAGGPRPLRHALRRPRAAAPSRRPRPRRRELDRAGAGPRPVPGGGRPDPRRGDRVGHFRFHLVGEKILHLDARSSTSTAASSARPRARASTTACATSARACAACAVTNGVAYAQALEEALGLRRPRARRAHDPPRARAGLEPPERHLRGLRRYRARRGRAALRRPHRARAAPQRAPHRPPVPLRERPRSVEATSSLDDEWSSPRETSSEPAVEAASGWRELLFNRSFDDRLVDVGVVRAKTRAGSAQQARQPGPRGSSHDAQRPARGLPTRASLPSSPAARLRRRQVAARAATRRARPVVRALESLSTGPLRSGRARRAAELSGGVVASRARAARRSASSNATAIASRAFTSAPARTRTGPWSRSPRSGTCSPTSRSSTRASSSATPARIADADAPQGPPPPAPRVALERPIAAAASRCATSTAARATAASTS